MYMTKLYDGKAVQATHVAVMSGEITFDEAVDRYMEADPQATVRTGVIRKLQAMGWDKGSQSPEGMDICGRCGGSGQYGHYGVCYDCNGGRYVPKEF